MIVSVVAEIRIAGGDKRNQRRFTASLAQQIFLNTAHHEFNVRYEFKVQAY